MSADYDERPLVYVLVLNWNGWQDTVKCVYSLKSLTYNNYKVVVLDNGSSNDSVTRIREAHPEVTLIETGANLGFAGGNNVGIRYALDQGAEYIWLLNNDTIVDPHSLTALIEVIESDTKIGAVGSVLYYMDEPAKIQAWGGGRVDLITGRACHLRAPGELHYITGASLLLRTKALKDVGLLDERYFMYWEDTDLSFRMRARGWRIKVAHESRVLHKESASVGRKNPRLAEYFNRSAIHFFTTHAPLPFLPIFIGTTGRFLKGLLRGRQWAEAVLNGTALGLRESKLL